MLKYFAVLLVGMVGWGVARAEDPAKLPKPTSYVSDFAGVVDAASDERLEELCREVHMQTQAAIHVVTVKSLDGMSIEEFSTALEDNWKIGAKGTDKGVLLVFAIAEHKRRIEVGYGLEGVLNDANVGDIGRSMVPQLQQGNYGLAMQVGVQQIADAIAKDAGVTLTQPSRSVTLGTPTYHREPARSRGFPWLKLILFVVFLLVFARGGGRGGGWMWFLLGNMMGGGGDRWGGGDGGGRGGGGGGDDFGSGFGGGSGGGGASGDW